MMKELREKIHVFWLNHRAQIIGLGSAAVCIIGTGAAVGYFADKAKKQIEEEKAEQAAKEEEARQKAREEYEAEEERIKNDPANQIASGGYIRPYNDELDYIECPNALVNEVPLSSMGEFGENILKRLNDTYFGDEISEEEKFQLETADADVYIYFGHEVWKRNQAEKSQEEQAS